MIGGKERRSDMSKATKHWKKVLAAAISAAMLGGLLSGCQSAGTENGQAEVKQAEGGQSEGESQDETGKTDSGEASEVSDSGNTGDVNEEGRPIVTIWSDWQVSEHFADQGDAYYWQEIEKATGVDLQFVDSSGRKDALSILIGTDDLPDIIIEYNGEVSGGVQKLLADGSILPLNELMDAGYMPNLKAYLESDPEVDKLMKNDEGLYAWAPMIRKADSPLVFNGNMIRQDWLDELGLAMPETIQEMEDVLLAFKEEKGCDTGYSFAWKNYQRMVNAFGICEEMYVGEDNKVHYGFIEDAYLDFLTLFNRWYEMGILDPDGFTQEIDAFYAKIATGRTGLVWGNTGGELGKIETMKADNPEIDYQPAPNPVLNKGDSFPVDISAFRVGDIGAMVSANCENKEAAAKVVDYVYGKEGDMLANFGVEGVTYEMVDGKPQFTEYVLNNPDGLSLQTALSFYAGDKNKSFLVDRIMMMENYPLDVQKKSLDVWATPDGKVKNLPSLALSAEETQEYSDIMTDIKTYADEFKLKFIMGTEPLENFPQFVENIQKMNIDRAIEIQQAAYDRFCAR